ncbi:ciliogenesis and planar polarity effector 1-like [Lethenteron reissneri]|uniref:ciliogenesis and planar polarity effector 1-like n=1 Tax=Lethenteron reissneri TaxID=7753 RepID=UPI002AB76263|nr:ciliogenesis and planar polarity effector 1-like [Lethenteron reissneri]
MQGRLEVLALASIKRRKPWPQIRWMGLDSENLLLLDERRASVLFLPSGRTRRRVPRLHSLLPRVVAMAPSRNGAWLAGVLVSGELFLWHKDTDSLKTAPAHPAVLALTSRAGEQGSNARLWVLPSDEGRRVLLGGAPDGPLLWELRGVEGPLHAVPGSLLLGRWAQLPPPSDVPLPGAADKEAAAHAVFFTDPELGDCCLCSFVFSAGQSLIISSLLLRWLDGSDALFSVAPFSATWHGFACALGSLSPACEAVKSRGAYVARLSSDGHVLAIAVNQRHPQATQVLFTSATGGVSVSSHLQGCGFRGPTLLPKFIRSYWVSDASWLSGDALLACMLKRGALLLVSRLGEPLTLSTHGCSVEFGPALFIPLHPLVTYSASGSADATASHGSAASEADALRQRFSVSAHPRLPFLLASDAAPARLVQAALEDVTAPLEDVRIGLADIAGFLARAVLLRSLSVLGAPPPGETVTVDATAAPPPLTAAPPFCSKTRRGGPFAGMHEESRTAEGETELTAPGGAIAAARISRPGSRSLSAGCSSRGTCCSLSALPALRWCSAGPASPSPYPSTAVTAGAAPPVPSYGARLSLEVAAALLSGADTGDTRAHLRSLLAALSLLSFAEAWLDRRAGWCRHRARSAGPTAAPEPCLGRGRASRLDDDEAPAEVAMEEAMADSVREGLGTGVELYALCMHRQRQTAGGADSIGRVAWRGRSGSGPSCPPARSAGRESSGRHTGA